MVSLFWLNSTTDAGQYPWPGGPLVIPCTSHSHLSVPLRSHTKEVIYRVSVRSLFILAILEETERSMVRSPISTMRPPRMSELT